MRALFKHTQRVAPPQLCQKPVEYAREQSLPLIQLTCPICTDIVARPVELTSCSSIVCCECLCQWLSTTENTKCPCCYEDHLQDCDTIKQPTQFFLLCVLAFIFIENLKDLIFVRYCEEGCSKRPAELQAWVHFCDFLDFCEGVSLSFRRSRYIPTA